MGALPRDHLRWLLSLDLSYPVRNVRRDFSNGFLVAEVLSRYFPSELSLHSFDNTASNVLRKRDNWSLLDKFCKKRGFVLSKADIDALVACEQDAAPPLVARLYDWLVAGPASAARTGAPATIDRIGDDTRGGGATMRGRSGSPSGRQLHHTTPIRGAPETNSRLRGTLGGTGAGWDDVHGDAQGGAAVWGTSTAVREMQDVSRSMWLGDTAACSGHRRGRPGYDEARAHRSWQQQQQQPGDDGGDDFPFTASDGEHPLPPDTVRAARLSRAARRSVHSMAQHGHQCDGGEFYDGDGYEEAEADDDEGGPHEPGPDENSLEARFSALQADYRAMKSASAVAPAASGHGGSASRRRRLISPEALLGADGDAPLVSWGLPAPASSAAGVVQAADMDSHGRGVSVGWSDDEAADDWGSQSNDGVGGAGSHARRRSVSPAIGGRLGTRVDFVPYTLADYKEHVAVGNAYWQLGSLGPDLDREDVIEKRAARQRALEFARQANSQNQVDIGPGRRLQSRARQGPQTAQERMRAWAQGTFAPGGGLLQNAPPEVQLRARSASPARRPGTDAGVVPAFRPGSTLSPTPLGMQRRKGTVGQ